MSEFLYFGLIALIVFRLIFMFGRERRWRGKPVTLKEGVAQVRVGRGKGNTVSFLAIGFDVPGGWRFNLRREMNFDRLAKWIGLAQEFQTRDEPFDHRIYVECDDAILHRQLAARRELRAQIRTLFEDRSIKSIECAEGQIWFMLIADGWDKNLADEQIGRAAAEPLQPGARVLREQLAAPVVGDETARDPSRVTRRHFAFTILAIAVAACIGLLWRWRNGTHRIVLDQIPSLGAGVTVALAAALLVSMVVTLGGTSRVQRVFLDIVFAGIPAAWLASYAGAMYFNESLDQSAARRVPVPVERSWVTTSSKGRHSYYAEFRWPDPRGTSILQLRPEEFDALQSLSCVDVLWRAGRFGDGWIERYQTHNSGTCAEEVEK